MDRAFSKNGSCKGIKKLLGSKPEGRRRIGRHGLRWMDVAENDMREMKINLLAPEFYI
jgi:hypothetical protein